MKTEWDYSSYADAYLKRPDYSEIAIDEMLECAALPKEAKICDIGAGAAHLTIVLAKRGFVVHAIEPNDEMRANGIKRTYSFKNVKWIEGVGENTKQENSIFDMVTFGSSFNVCDRQKALVETSRILKYGGYLACMWNYRNLDDPIQKGIEDIIKSNIEGYSYGTRREDPTKIILDSGLFSDIKKIEGSVLHKQSIKDCVEAWRSHATLGRQAHDKFDLIIGKIEKYLYGLESTEIVIPYTTRIWIAKCTKSN